MMKKFYGIMVMVVGLFLKTSVCCAQETEKPIQTNSQASCCLQLPIDSLPRQLQFPETPLACFEPYSQDTRSTNFLACFESCLPACCFTDTSDYFNISQDSNFLDPVKSSIEIRQGLWSAFWLYDNADDLSLTQRKELARYLNKSYELCEAYDHPAKEMLPFVRRILNSSQERIQADIQSYLKTFLLTHSENLDMVEMQLSSVPFLSGRFLDKERIMFLANQLIRARRAKLIPERRAKIAAQYLYTISAGAMLIDGNYGDYKGYLLLAAKHKHPGARKLLDRINAKKQSHYVEKIFRLFNRLGQNSPPLAA